MSDNSLFPLHISLQKFILVSFKIHYELWLLYFGAVFQSLKTIRLLLIVSLKMLIHICNCYYSFSLCILSLG